jgi:hypothetical protein
MIDINTKRLHDDVTRLKAQVAQQVVNYDACKSKLAQATSLALQLQSEIDRLKIRNAQLRSFPE